MSRETYSKPLRTPTLSMANNGMPDEAAPGLLPPTDPDAYCHLVVNPYDPNQDYAQFAKDVFNPDSKALVVRESKNGYHVHIQGEVINWSVLKKRKYELADQHEARKRCKRAKPVRQRSKPADAKGFRYMSKDLPKTQVIYKQHITDEELDALHEESLAHVANLKTGVLDSIRAQFEDANTERVAPSVLHRQVSLFAQKHYLENHKMDPPNIRGLVRFWVRELFGHRLDVLEYLSELNL